MDQEKCVVQKEVSNFTSDFAELQLQVLYVQAIAMAFCLL